MDTMEFKHDFIRSMIRDVMEEVKEDDASGVLLGKIINTDNSLEMDFLESYIADVVYVLLNYYEQHIKSLPETKFDTIPFNDVPEEWLDRCSGEGHERTTDEHGNKIYSDSGNVVQEEGWRPCAKCGKFPNENGDDHCIQNLGRVINACCGHGKNKGYIMFDDGRIIEGYFTVKNLWED